LRGLEGEGDSAGDSLDGELAGFVVGFGNAGSDGILAGLDGLLCLSDLLGDLSGDGGEQVGNGSGGSLLLFFLLSLFLDAFILLGSLGRFLVVVDFILLLELLKGFLEVEVDNFATDQAVADLVGALIDQDRVEAFDR
jgi:hypothetical protein